MKWLKHLLWKNVTQDPQYEENQMNCPEITLDGIDKDLYARLLEELSVVGAKLDGSKVTIAGCDFDWNYDEATQTLHATCTRKPFYASCAEVESRIREQIEKSKGGI